MAEQLKLRPEVAAAFKLQNATPETQVSHPHTGVIRLGDLNLEQAQMLAAEGCQHLVPVNEKATGK
ncbi:MAG: hypothetical protein C0424_10345 [Sphingobacteriaceae bacterium]|nr:hypothetical protein [Sphingobacteriaceae bacterium]